ncbi:MAG: hypothetical protein CO149_05300 [Nitrospirae bacterium CG_4_9_14_3_um_filter_51_5]|nr:MAG: hypothetical protein CO149_05300 [Nitrospirae bacterium CG_4_9_14_3_um_filter_51_5]
MAPIQPARLEGKGHTLRLARLTLTPDLIQDTFSLRSSLILLEMARGGQRAVLATQSILGIAGYPVPIRLLSALPARRF